MANTRAAEKAIRQSARRRNRNRVVRAMARTEVKDANKLIAEGNIAEAEQAARAALCALDRAAEKGILKKNNAARRKSRLMKKLNQLRASNQVLHPPQV